MPAGLRVRHIKKRIEDCTEELRRHGWSASTEPLTPRTPPAGPFDVCVCDMNRDPVWSGKCCPDRAVLTLLVQLA